MDNYKCTYTESGATTIKIGAGILRAVIIGSTPSKAIEVYDSIGSGGTKIAELKASLAEGTYRFDCNFASGLHITNPGGGKLSVIYR